MKRKSEIFFFVFQETELSYISGSNFPSSKSKKKTLVKSLLCFGKWNFLVPNIYISGKNLKSLKHKRIKILLV